MRKLQRSNPVIMSFEASHHLHEAERESQHLYCTHRKLFDIQNKHIRAAMRRHRAQPDGQRRHNAEGGAGTSNRQRLREEAASHHKAAAADAQGWARVG